MSPSSTKVCAVCGDKALGFNFNAVTCESCKAFFRRNALANKQFTCPFNQNCEVTVVTRRFCQKCRLKKCMDIGMRSENIMSEEDKMVKRRKIESNREKRRQTDVKSSPELVKQDKVMAADSSGEGSDLAYNHSIDSCGSFDSTHAGSTQPTSTSSASMMSPISEVNPELMTGEEMVEFIVVDPDRASQAISKLMRTPSEAMATLEKIINSQKDALRLISHLIAYPGDALKIISKIMNSPFNALTVFTKFMSSPTDALEIISKIVSSPQDVLQFIKNLMDTPEEGLEIMNKFMNTPAEALKIINKIFNGNNTAARSNESVNNELLQETIIKGTALLHSQQHILPTAEENHQAVSPPQDSIINSMLTPSPELSTVAMPSSPLQQSDLLYEPLTPTTSGYSASHPLTPAHSVIESNLEQFPLKQPVNEPSTSTSVLSHSSKISANTSDLSSSSNFEPFDLKTFNQPTFPPTPDPQQQSMSFLGDSLSSLESVLSEVIRIEFQAFNNLPPEVRGVKQEKHGQQRLISDSSTGSGCYADGAASSSSSSVYSSQHYNQQIGGVCSPTSVIVGRDLNDTEQMKLRELKLASEALYLPVDDDLSVLMGDDRIKAEESHQDPKLLQVVNLTAVAIKRLIKMAKKITAFRDMCQEDQVALLKGGCTEMMIMRSVMIYNDDRNTWKIPHTKEEMSNVRAEVLKLAKGNVYEEHLKFIRTFDEKWRMDENIILIMCAIVLFTPTRLRVIHSDVIRLEQNSYYYLLRRYLESVYPGCEAKSAFIKLIQKISDVERLNQFMIGVYLNVNPSQVEPLLREIFDIKNH